MYSSVSSILLFGISSFPFKLENVKPREDEKIEVIDTEIALSNAKEKVGTEVKVPKVVE